VEEKKKEKREEEKREEKQEDDQGGANALGACTLDANKKRKERGWNDSSEAVYSMLSSIT